MNQHQNMGTAIARKAIEIVKEAGSLNETEGLPYLKLSSCLIKTATDIGYGLTLEDAVKRQFDPDDQLDAYNAVSGIVKEAAGNEEKEDERTFLGTVGQGALEGGLSLGLVGGVGGYGYARGKLDHVNRPSHVTLPPKIMHVLRSRIRSGEPVRVSMRASELNNYKDRLAKRLTSPGKDSTFGDKYLMSSSYRTARRAALAGALLGGLTRGTSYLWDKHLSNSDTKTDKKESKPVKKKASAEREDSLADKLLSRGLEGAGYGGLSTGLILGGGSRLVEPGIKHTLTSGAAGGLLGIGVGGTLGLGRGAVEYLLEQLRKKKKQTV